MKKIVTGTSIVFSAALLGSIFIESGVTTTVAHADTVEKTAKVNPQEQIYPKFVSEDQADKIIDNYLSTANQQQLEAIQQKVKSYARTTVDGDETTVSIDDDIMQTAIMDVISPNTSIFQTRKKKGKTKLVWHGKASKGNVDVYISASMLNHAKQAGFHVLAQICLLPLGALGGVAGAAVRDSLTTALSHIFTGVQKPFKYGRVFHFKGGKYKSWSYQ
ncbi:hypothetical protein DA798_07695 [Lactobacillus sp. PFC-70]|nr:hypothetical protein DA798_07695 [Lactobacillus sp. PFC-70]